MKSKPESEHSVDDAPELKDRVNAAWEARRVAEFYTLLMEEVTPRLRRYLRSRWRYDDDEIDDCISMGFERFYGRQQESPGEIEDPYNYFYTVVVRAAIDTGRQQQQDQEVQAIAADIAGYEFGQTPRGTSGHTTQPVVDYTQVKPSESWAAMLMGEVVEGVEAVHAWYVPVVGRAIAKLPEAQRRVIKYLCEREFDYTKNDLSVQSREGARALGIQPNAFRKNKQRAYESLRRLIPEVIEDLGVRLPRHLEEAIFIERPDDLDEDGH